MTTTEQQTELELSAKLSNLKYTYYSDIRERTALKALNHVPLTDSKFKRLINSITTPDVYKTALRLYICEGKCPLEFMAQMDLVWKARAQKELALMEELTPLLHKLAQTREIAGHAAYKEGI